MVSQSDFLSPIVKQVTHADALADKMLHNAQCASGRFDAPHRSIGTAWSMAAMGRFETCFAFASVSSFIAVLTR
jgi:hypothetical protein|tara:strand:+ start:286 stop:507 length:222 start_codon:yes stop_codon:yes gene_type:complete